ncbi:MAG TPA: stage VI sporulation protein D, partial [Chondromyces sp.]|nr:stage VI sporulation protein D [Chondromyces sp.]
MSYQDQSSLRFSLEESIWFKKGQEVEELFSISLDPQITISERDQFVYIQGHLELSGEYQSTEEEAGEEDYSNVKFVREILNRENGECEFYHNFPIDVTIPKNRIENMDDVEIYIDSFDYDLPEKACLKLTVDLSISGIYGEQQNHGISALGEREQEELIEVVPRVTAEQPIEREENFEPEVPKATGLQEETAEEEQLTEEPEREIESFTFSAVAHRIASGNSEEEAKKEPIVSRSWNEESDID